VGQGDATDPRPPSAPYDAIGSSMVVFFLPDPAAALTRWRGLLRDGGRLGLATVRPWRDGWLALDVLIEEYVDRGAPSPEADDGPDVWATDAGVEALLDAAGFDGVRTDVATLGIRFTGLEEWRDWTMGTFMRALWDRTPESAHPEIERRATEILEGARDDSGMIVLEVDARYTLGRA